MARAAGILISRWVNNEHMVLGFRRLDSGPYGDFNRVMLEHFGVAL